MGPWDGEQIFPHGEIISNALPSRRLLFDRLGLGDGSYSCSVCKLFDDNIQNEAYTEADWWSREKIVQPREADALQGPLRETITV